MVDDEVLDAEHVDDAVLEGVQAAPCGDVPDDDLLVGAAADEDVFGAEFGADDGFDEVRVADVFAPGGFGGEVPGPDGLVPGPGEEGAGVGAADGDAADWGGGAAVDGLGVLGLLRTGNIRRLSFLTSGRPSTYIDID